MSTDNRLRLLLFLSRDQAAILYPRETTICSSNAEVEFKTCENISCRPISVVLTVRSGYVGWDNKHQPVSILQLSKHTSLLPSCGIHPQENSLFPDFVAAAAQEITHPRICLFRLTTQTFQQKPHRCQPICKQLPRSDQVLLSPLPPKHCEQKLLCVQKRSSSTEIRISHILPVRMRKHKSHAKNVTFLNHFVFSSRKKWSFLVSQLYSPFCFLIRQLTSLGCYEN